MQKKSRVMAYSLLSLISLAALVNFSAKQEDFSILETSVLTALKAAKAQIPTEALPDPTIEKVTLKKIGDATDDFRYNRYRSTVILANSGGDIRNKSLLISAGGKNAFVKNTDFGFSLKNDQRYIVRNFEVLTADDFNAGAIDFSISLTDDRDSDLQNNSFTVPVFEKDAKLADLSVVEVDEDGKIALSLDDRLASSDLTLWMKKGSLNGERDLEYREIFSDGSLYNFYVMPNSQKFLEDDNFAAHDFEKNGNDYEIDLGDDPNKTAETYYFYFQSATDTQGQYLTSDVIKLVPQRLMTRAEFARAFVEYTGLAVQTAGEVYYDDLADYQAYLPYIRTIYNLGLTDTESLKFYPEKYISRAEVLPIVADYFDGDLEISSDAPHFKDVSEKDDFYEYVEGLYAADKAPSIRGYFNPKLSATSDFLNYLINEYRENN